MTKQTSWAIALTATTFLSAPAMAVSLTPTLDALKTEAGSVLPSVTETYTLTELTGELPAGAVKVEIGDKDYYFTPSGEYTGLLTTLAGTSAGMLQESSDGLFELDGKKYGFDIASIPDSVFSYSEGTADDYNFTIQEADAEGKLTTKYYKVNLKPETFSTSSSIGWSEVGEDHKDDKDDDLSDGSISGVVEVQLPNNQVKYFKYTYTKPDNYTVSDVRIDDTLGSSNVTNVVFKGISSSVSGGAIYNAQNHGDIDIKADFIGNYLSGANGGAYGGAIYNHSTSTIGNISGDFIWNWAKEILYAYGGAIANYGTIGNITSDFIGNYVTGSDQIKGGAIYSTGKIGNISGGFIGNYSSAYTSASGGAIYNVGTIDDVTGDFIGNYVTCSHCDKSYGGAAGGAIYNYKNSTIGDITGDFIGNYASATKNISGGAISNQGTIGNITGDFIGNSSKSIDASGTYGGAISNIGTIEDITGNFIGNYVSSSGGAISNGRGVGAGRITNITGDFIGNYAQSTSAYVEGGAIDNRGIIGNLTGNFINNYAQSTSAHAHGGAIINLGGSADITGNISGDFIGNCAQTSSRSYTALGGAILTGKSITFKSNGEEHFFSGNYSKDPTRGKNYNALFVRGTARASSAPTVTFDTTGGGAWIINDNIDGGDINYPDATRVTYNNYYYNLTFKGNNTIDASTGTTTQYIAMNNDIINARTVTVNGTTLRFGSYQHEDQTAKNWDGKGAFVASLNEDGTANRDAAAVTTLSLNNGVFDIANGYLETVKLKGYSATDSFMHIDVDVENMKADELHVAGNVEGVTKMIVHASSNADIRNRGQILFAQSENDSTGNAGSFVVSRVYKSPYLFDVKYDQIADNSNKWYFEMNDQPNEEPKEPEKPDVPDVPDIPDVPDVPTPELPDIPSIKPQPLPGSDRPVAPEVIGAESLPAAGLAQTTNMIYNIMQKVSSNRFYCPGCGFYDYYWNGEAFHNLWANAVYNTLRIKTPTDIDAEVWGLEAGGDLQHDLNNKLGLFLSYRKGNYDMNGDGKHHYSTVGSEIDIDSYLAGLYYRYDRNNWWTFATVYGGIQRVDLKTKDGIKSDTDGTEFGGSVELGYDYAINKTVYLTPSVGAFYTQVDYDDATDSAGKVAKYNTLRQLELEAGVKLTKAFVMDEGYANLYVKPSVVQTVTDGDEVRITGLGKVNTIDDQTLGRIEIGGRYGFTEQLSAYGWANHTFGDDYKASTFGLGLSYSW